jgi:hypothetical protein
VTKAVATAVFERLMLDPSILFWDRAIDWLEGHAAERTELVVSSTFYGYLTGGFQPNVFAQYVPPEERDALSNRWGRVAPLIANLQRFSFDSVRLPSELLNDVSGALVAGNSPQFADEWAYLHSQSIMVARLRNPLDAFRSAGAAIVEYGSKLRDQAIQLVVPSGNVTARQFITQVVPKWIVVGGATAGGSMLGPGGALMGLGSVPVVRAFDP